MKRVRCRKKKKRLCFEFLSNASSEIVPFLTFFFFFKTRVELSDRINVLYVAINYAENGHVRRINRRDVRANYYCSNRVPNGLSEVVAQPNRPGRLPAVINHAGHFYLGRVIGILLTE